MNSVLVVGAGGQLGQPVCRALQEAGWSVILLTRPTSRVAAQPNAIVLPEPWSNDVLHDAIQRSGARAIVNLAGAGVVPGRDDAAALASVNARLPAQLALAGVGAISVCVNIGSGAEYAGNTTGAPLDEAAPLNPSHAYGASKAEGAERLLQQASSAGISAAHLRLFGVYGEHEAGHRLLPTLVRSLSGGQPVALSMGDQIRDWLYEGDVSAALVAAVSGLSAGTMSSGIYNLGSGVGHSVRDFAETAAAALDVSPALLHFGATPRREAEVDALVADTRRFSRATDWTPGISWSEGISRSIERLRQTVCVEGI